MKRKKLLLMASIVLALSLTACGQAESTGAEESTVTTEEASAPTETTTNEDAEATAIIENAGKYNATDNLFSWEDYADNRSSLFVSEDNSKGYAVILDELEEKTGSAQEQITGFYDKVSALFPAGTEVYDPSNEVSQVYYYYHNIAVNPSWAMEDIYFHASVSGGNEVRTENSWAPPTFASGETLHMADAIMYAPSYLKKCIDDDINPTMEDMVNQMCTMTRDDCGLMAVRSLDESNGNPDNEVYNDYQYAHASLYIPYYETVYNMGLMYSDLSTVAEHELYFSAPINVSTEYSSYDYTTGRMESAYIIAFYDKTDDIYGEGVFDADNNLVGICFPDAPAMKIIAYTSSFNTTDNIYEYTMFDEDPSKFFLAEEDMGAYGIILKDLDQKTNNSRELIINLYSNIDSIFSEDTPILDSIQGYYSNIKNDESVADRIGVMYAGGKFKDGEDILASHLIAYIPYYLSTPTEGKVYSLQAILDELATVNKSDTFLADLSYDMGTLGKKVPLYSFMVGLGNNGYDFSTLSENELIFSSPITVSSDWWVRDFVNGSPTASYIYFVHDKTSDVYAEACFTPENEIFLITLNLEVNK